MALSLLLIRFSRSERTDPLAPSKTQCGFPCTFGDNSAGRSGIRIGDPRESQCILDPAAAIAHAGERAGLHFRKGAIIDISPFSHARDKGLDRGGRISRPAPFANLTLKILRQFSA